MPQPDLRQVRAAAGKEELTMADITVARCPVCKTLYDTPQKTWTCGNCGKQGFSCCVPGPHELCNECHEKYERREI